MKIIHTAVVIFFSMNLLACAANQQDSDVSTFIQRRDICDHLRGEFPDPPNPERTKEIIEGVKEYCTGTDAQLAALKVRYANDPSIIARLNAYAPRIERINR